MLSQVAKLFEQHFGVLYIGHMVLVITRILSSSEHMISFNATSYHANNQSLSVAFQVDFMTTQMTEMQREVDDKQKMETALKAAERARKEVRQQLGNASSLHAIHNN